MFYRNELDRHLVDPDESISGSVDEDAAAGGPVVEGLRAPQEPVAVVEQKPIPKKQNIENILVGWNAAKTICRVCHLWTKLRQ